MKNFDKRIKDIERRTMVDVKPFLISHWKDGLLDGVTSMTLKELHKYSKNRLIIIFPSRN